LYFELFAIPDAYPVKRFILHAWAQPILSLHQDYLTFWQKNRSYGHVG